MCIKWQKNAFYITNFLSITKATYRLVVTFSPLSMLSTSLILPWGRAGQLQHFCVGQSTVWVPLTTGHIWPAGFALSVFLSDGVWPFASLLGSGGEGEMAVWVAGLPSGWGPGSAACLLGDRRHRSAPLASFFSLRLGGPPSPNLLLYLSLSHTHTPFVLSSINFALFHYPLWFFSL